MDLPHKFEEQRPAGRLNCDPVGTCELIKRFIIQQNQIRLAVAIRQGG
jgi:hypothetical protein